MSEPRIEGVAQRSPAEERALSALLERAGQRRARARRSRRRAALGVAALLAITVAADAWLAASRPTSGDASAPRSIASSAGAASMAAEAATTPAAPESFRWLVARFDADGRFLGDEAGEGGPSAQALALLALSRALPAGDAASLQHVQAAARRVAAELRAAAGDHDAPSGGHGAFLPALRVAALLEAADRTGDEELRQAARGAWRALRTESIGLAGGDAAGHWRRAVLDRGAELAWVAPSGRADEPAALPALAGPAPDLAAMAARSRPATGSAGLSAVAMASLAVLAER